MNLSKESPTSEAITVKTVFKDTGTSRDYAQHRHDYSEELFQVISDYCREGLKDLNLAVDVGCGPGNSTVGFTQHFKQVIGVDISETQIAQAPDNIPNCQFKVGSATNLDFLDPGSVDLFTCGMAFHLMPQEEMLAEADRVLRPGGSLAIFFYGVPKCTNERMNQVVQWMFSYGIPKGGREMAEVAGLHKDLSLPYPGWTRKDDIVLSQTITPDGIMAIHKCIHKFMVMNGHEDPDYEKEMKERLAAALQEIRKEPESDKHIFELRFRSGIILGRKPL